MLRPWSDRSSEWFEECFRASGGGEKNKKEENGSILKPFSGRKAVMAFSFPLSFSPSVLSLPSLSFCLLPSLPCKLLHGAELHSRKVSYVD